MQRIRKFLSLTATDQRLFITSALLLGVVRLGLWLLPFRTLQRLLADMTRTPTALQIIDQSSIDRVSWAVTVASRHVPAATCLTQALTTQVLLGRRGCPTTLRIGVTRGERGEFQAHAWVDIRGGLSLEGVTLRHALPPWRRWRGKACKRDHRGLLSLPLKGEINLSDKKQPILLNGVVVANREQISANLGDEVVILHLNADSYYGLDQVGVFVWNLIQEPRKVSDIRDAIFEEYKVDSSIVSAIFWPY